jgi:hypothetical protein
LLASPFLSCRARTFSREIVHMPMSQMTWVKRAWNLQVGTALLEPWMIHRKHTEHHEHEQSATPGDGENLPHASSPIRETIEYLAQSPLLPLCMLLRFGVATPVARLQPKLRERVDQPVGGGLQAALSRAVSTTRSALSRVAPHSSGAAVRRDGRGASTADGRTAGGFAAQGYLSREFPRRRARNVAVCRQPGAPPRHGFFPAGALVDSIIRRTHDRRAQGQVRLQVGHLSPAWRMVRLAALALVGRTGLHCPTLDIDVPGGAGRRGPIRPVLATTPWHRRGAFRAYADSGNGRPGCTGATRLAPGFRRSLPGLATGRPAATMTAADGGLSRRVGRAVVGGLEGCSLGGGECDADATRHIILSAGPAFRFLMP